MVEVGGGLRPPPIGSNVKFVEKLKICSTLKLNSKKSFKVIKSKSTSQRKMNVLNS